MKRHLIIMSVLIPLMTACSIDNPQNSNHTEKDLNYYASLMADSRLVFPMVLAETAISIDTYLGMSAEDKVGMTYIFSNLLQTQQTVYEMDRFFGMKVSTDGKSLTEHGSAWEFESTNGSFYGYDWTEGIRRFRLIHKEDGEDWEWELKCDIGGSHPYSIFFRSIQEDEAWYNWEISMKGTSTSPQERSVEFETDGTVKRAVYRKSEEVGESQTKMDGGLILNIYEADMDHLDEVSYRFDSIKSQNPHYDF